MYCINCGVKLADTENKCPLCATAVYHPDFKREAVPPLYPENKHPQPKPASKAFNGAIIILFFIPLLTSLLSDLQTNGTLSWFGYVAGALLLSYIIFALPLWFEKPHPVIFTPCNFLAIGLYLLYIDLVTHGGWFLSFGLPATFVLALIVCAMVTLLHYLRKGKLYVWGGTFIALGLYIVLIEFLLYITFHIRFVGWSFYPLIALGLFGGMLIYLAINRTARETMERKLFF